MAGLDRGLILGAMLVAQDATQNAPIDTGRLKRSIKAGRPYTRPALRQRRAIKVGTNVVYAPIQEFGGDIPPHLIRPRVKKALAWEGEDGKMRFSKLVNHPGARIPAQPYLRPAIRRKRQQVKVLIYRSVVGAMKG